MVDKKKSAKTKKRQLSKLPLSRAKSNKKSSSVKKKTTTKVTNRKPATKTKVYLIWFGPNRRLQIKLVPARKKARKKSPKNKKISQSKKWSLGVASVGLIASVYFSLNIFVNNKPPIVYSAPAPAQVAAEPQKEDEKVIGLKPSVPVSLKIESVGINSDLSEVGRNDDGTLTVPTSFDSAGWYKYSPTPGELGPAIITGHVDSYKGPAVFWRLGQVKIDDTINIMREDGSEVIYKVTDVKQFDQANFPTSEVYGNIDHVGLRLITCGGVFNRTTQSYSHNTVVFARFAE